MNRFVKKAIVPIIDLSLVITGLFGIAFLYQRIEEIIIPLDLLQFALPIYGVIWFLSQVFVGGYDKPVKLIKNGLGAIVGTSTILVIYALLSKDFQFSRLIILLGGIWVAVYFVISRIVFHFVVGRNYRIGGAKNKRFVIIGDEKEVDRVNLILNQTNSKIESVDFLSYNYDKAGDKYLGNLSQLDQVIDIHNIEVVIFCAKNISAEDMITKMLALGESKVDFKIAQPETSFLIGSSSIDSKGDLYVTDINRINKPANQRNKRLIDIFLAFDLIVLSPLIIWVYKDKPKFYRNMFSVFFGKLSFVGYERIEHQENLKLPSIRRGVLSSIMMVSNTKMDQDAIARLNLIYAKNHSYLMDLKIILRNFRKLDK